MNRIMASLTISACLLLPSAGVAFATGQPGSSAGVACGTGNATLEPGNASSAPGAPFNEPAPIGTTLLGGIGGQHYAGNPGTPSLMHSQSGNAVSQYDVACLNNTQNHPQVP
jgi:hypothetical protein